MSKKIVDDYSIMTMKIEEIDTIKTEVSDDLYSIIPLTDLIGDERGDVLEFDEGATRFIKPEPIGGMPSGTSNIGETNTIKTQVADSDESQSSRPIDFKPDERGNVVEFCEGEVRFINPEPNESKRIGAGSSGSSNAGGSGSVVKRVKSHVCPECDKAFFSKASLDIHFSAIHLKLKEFVCGECDRAFSQLGHLNVHRDRVHKKIKKFTCGECDSAFTAKSDLKRHFDSVHRKLKKFVCGKCVRGFSQKGHLNLHLDMVHRKSIVLSDRKHI